MREGLRVTKTSDFRCKWFPENMSYMSNIVIIIYFTVFHEFLREFSEVCGSQMLFGFN